MRRPLAAFATCLLVIATVVPAALAGDVEKRPRRRCRARAGRDHAHPGRPHPDKLLVDAEAIAVIPSVIKAGFGVGGRRGRGLIAVRSRDRTWSNPSYITLTGGSFGFQAGVQSTDVILVFRTRRGVDSIVGGKFTLGADASVAAGPVGRSAQASTDERLKAEILSYSRARGLFAGVALDGTRLAIDNKSNARVYGAGHTAREIFEGRAGTGNETTVAFRDKLEESTVPQKAR
jgi:lipid-binding SYLF domain-containing protein